MSHQIYAVPRYTWGNYRQFISSLAEAEESSRNLGIEPLPIPVHTLHRISVPPGHVVSSIIHPILEDKKCEDRSSNDRRAELEGLKSGQNDGRARERKDGNGGGTHGTPARARARARLILTITSSCRHRRQPSLSVSSPLSPLDMKLVELAPSVAPSYSFLPPVTRAKKGLKCKTLARAHVGDLQSVGRASLAAVTRKIA